ncbi:MAG: hypothetical protein AB7E55_12050, partial [Pigmentiphaga sp.]
MSTIMTLWMRRSVLTASLAALGLAACGGSDDDPSAQNEAIAPGAALAVDKNSCLGVPEVASESGYPIYLPPESAADLQDPAKREIFNCNVLRHYEAGYAIVANDGIDPDPWNDSNVGATVLAASTVEEEATLGVESPDSSELLLVDDVARRSVYARHPNGHGAPWECRAVTTASESILDEVQACLAELRNAALEATANNGENHGLPRSVSAADDAGAAVVPMDQWTILGAYTKRLSFSSDNSLDIFGKYHKGTSEASFDVYRLNSLDSYDYFLVKATLATTPNFFQEGSCSRTHGCGYF